ncbi:MAG: glycosyltransferase [Candidatus Altiarchaeota archaeon]
MVKASIITITYNRSKLLKKMIDSILTQTFRDFELIIVDNFSTDDTESVVKSFADKRIRYFKNANNGILAINLNYGMKKAEGDYIAFCDSDDLWMPEKLEKQLAYLKRHPEYGLVYSNAWIIDENENQKGVILGKTHSQEGELFESLLEGDFIPVLTVFMRRKVIDTVGFFNERHHIRPAEDYEFLLRASLHYKIGYIAEPLAMYREHSGMMSREINFGKIRQNVLFSIVSDPLVSNKTKLDDIAHSLYPMSAKYHWKKSDKSEAYGDLKKYLAYSIRHYRLVNILWTFYLWTLFKFDYNRLKSIKTRLFS